MSKSTYKTIDYLTEDEVMQNQKWVCMSFLSPEGLLNCKIRGLKIRGCYASREEADARAKRLQTIDPDFHVFVGEIGKWLPWDPDPNSVEDHVYREEKLNEIMKKYKENQTKTKLMEDERKNAMLAESVRTKENENKVKDRLRKKLEKKKQNGASGASIEEFENDVIKPKSNVPDNRVNVLPDKANPDLKKTIDNHIEKLETTQKLIDENKSEISKKREDLGSVEDQLSKIESLYKKLQAKKNNASN